MPTSSRRNGPVGDTRSGANGVKGGGKPPSRRNPKPFREPTARSLPGGRAEQLREPFALPISKLDPNPHTRKHKGCAANSEATFRRVHDRPRMCASCVRLWLGPWRPVPLQWRALGGARDPLFPSKGLRSACRLSEVIDPRGAGDGKLHSVADVLRRWWCLVCLRSLFFGWPVC